MNRERIASLPNTDWRKASMHFQEPNLSANLALVEILREIGERYGRSPGEVSIAWTLRNPAVTGAIFGARRPAQIDGVTGAAQLRLSAADLEAGRLAALGGTVLASLGWAENWHRRLAAAVVAAR